MRNAINPADIDATGNDARQRTAQVLEEAIRRSASDVHLEPTADGYELRFRVDGLLGTDRRLSATAGRAMVNRLMVLAQLLTYHTRVPQEGRLTHASPSQQRAVDLRLAVMPTTHGLRAAIRLPADLVAPVGGLDKLGLPAAALEGLRTFAASDAGMLLLVGPAGSGKTTTIYGLLEHILEREPGLSVISLEDPVERDLKGVTQIELDPFGPLTCERCLPSVLRQDPQVLALGEIRDAATARIAIQAALSGHRLISTLHAAGPGGAVARLLEMDIEPHQLAGSLFGVLAQRLLRRGSEQTGYRGRLPIASWNPVDDAVRAAILGGEDTAALDRRFGARRGHETLLASARRAVAAKLTDQAELTRVLGPEAGPGAESPEGTD